MHYNRFFQLTDTNCKNFFTGLDDEMERKMEEYEEKEYQILLSVYINDKEECAGYTLETYDQEGGHAEELEECDDVDYDYVLEVAKDYEWEIEEDEGDCILLD